MAAGNEEVTADNSITQYRPDGTTRTLADARQVPGEIFRGTDLVRAARSGKGIELAYEVVGDLPPAVLGDFGRLRQILLS